MIKLRQLFDWRELRHDMILLSVDSKGNECLEKVTCIDNGKLWTYGLADNLESNGEDLNDLFEYYSAIYEVLS